MNLPSDFYLKIVVVIAFVIASIYTKKVDVKGAMMGGVVTAAMIAGASWIGLTLIIVFFGVGSAASVHRIAYKQSLGVAEKNKAQRSIPNVLANGAVAATCGILAFCLPEKAALFTIAMAASIAAALSDTLSSELGNAYGSHYFNILNFKKDTRGKDGVVSLEGFGFGIVGSVLIATVYASFYGITPAFFTIALAGFIGNLIDSILGATFQQQHILTNHTVNFWNTVAAASVAILLSI